MSVPFSSLRPIQTRALLDTVARGDCCALIGLSNAGKSPLLRSLPLAENLDYYARRAGRPGALIYIDCNRVVELTAPGFYEIVVRSLLEALEDAAPPASAGLLELLREQHNLITSAPSVFQASLAFNNAVSEGCLQLERNLVLLLDEFDEVYAALEERALLNLRALKDKFGDRLAYITATARPLADSRSPNADEFAELFAGHVVPVGLLSEAEARRMIELSGGAGLAPETTRAVLRWAGGHAGLLAALTHTAVRSPRALVSDPNARAECLKIWNQLRPDEQAALKLLVTESQDGPTPHDRQRLRTLGLLVEGDRIFCDWFAQFVRRQCDAPAQQTTGVMVDEDAGEVWVDGVKVSVLTDLEYRLMRLLYERQDRLTTKEMLVEAVWGGQYFDQVDDGRIEKLVSRLRAKIEPDPSQPRYLLTQRGRGYKLSGRPLEPKAEASEV